MKTHYTNRHSTADSLGYSVLGYVGLGFVAES